MLFLSSSAHQSSLGNFEQEVNDGDSLTESDSDDTGTTDESNADAPEQEESLSKKGLIYGRVSSSDQVDTDEETEDEGSIDDQIAECQAIAEREGIELPYDPIVDKAQTGTNFERDGIQKVFRLAQKEEIGFLLTQSVDRIGRSAAETLYFIHVLQSKCNVTLITPAGERNMNEIHGLLHTTLLSLMAEVQNEIRTTKAKKSRVRGFLKKKNWHCYDPTVPVGYTMDGSGWLEPNPKEADAVVDLFEKFVECGVYAKTKRKINANHDEVLEGHRVKTLLQKSVYMGKPRLPEDWVVDMPYDNELEEPELQIVDEGTFHQAQEIIEEKNEVHSTDSDTKDVIDFVEQFDLFSVIESSPPATLLHDCGEPMVKNGQRDLKGDVEIHLYRCPKCDECRKWPKEAEYDLMELIYKIRNGVLNLSDIWN